MPQSRSDSSTDHHFNGNAIAIAQQLVAKDPVVHQRGNGQEGRIDGQCKRGAPRLIFPLIATHRFQPEGFVQFRQVITN